MGPLVPLVYGNDYFDTITPIRILLLTLIFLSIQRIYSFYLLLNGMLEIIVRSASYSAMIVILLDSFLIPFFWVNGAVLANLTAITVEDAYIINLFAAN